MQDCLLRLAFVAVCGASWATGLFAQEDFSFLNDPPFYLMNYTEIVPLQTSDPNDPDQFDQKGDYLRAVLHSLRRLRPAPEHPLPSIENVNQLDALSRDEAGWTRLAAAIYYACQKGENGAVCEQMQQDRLDAFQTFAADQSRRLDRVVGEYAISRSGCNDGSDRIVVERDQLIEGPDFRCLVGEDLPGDPAKVGLAAYLATCRYKQGNQRRGSLSVEEIDDERAVLILPGRGDEIVLFRCPYLEVEDNENP